MVVLRTQKRLSVETNYKEIKQRFLKLNNVRLQRTYDDLRQSQREFVQLLPLLFHVNHPILPGYVAKSTPAGIPDYSVSSETIRTAAKKFKSFAYKKRAYRKFEIHAIYLMGSSGSIAYSNKSDFDIWVCHSSELSGSQLQELEAKAEGVEKWARDAGIEANIYLVDPKKFKNGELRQLSSESSGSALHYLLLEEFYRTSLLLAGRYPVWWLIPPDQEDQYDDIVRSFHDKRFIHAKEHIDFGSLNQIPAEEFYGATLWLLYKSINSPYKSIIKILLMQVYAWEFPDIEMLAVKFKQAVFNDDIDINSLDPYLMILDKVETFLMERNDFDRLDLVRRSFYIKVGITLSNKNTTNKETWRSRVMLGLVRKWDWVYSKMFMLDTRNDWNVKRVQEERKQLISEFTKGYQFLSNFTRDSILDNTVISQTDMNVLGRKLYAAFERKAGKIDLIHQGITDDLYETHLSIHKVSGHNSEDHSKSEQWTVYSGVIDEVEAHYQNPIRRTTELIELIAWCYFNKVINCNTVVALYTENSDLSEKEIHHTIASMEKLFPHSLLSNASFQDYSKPARIVAVGTFLNIGIDPLANYTRHGHQIATSRTDALSFGGLWENLALSMEQVIITSWQEVLTYRYFGVKGLMNCIRDYIQWAPPSSGMRPPAINAYSFSSYRGPSIAQRIENVFEHIINFFYTPPVGGAKRYILGIEWDYYILQMEQDSLGCYAAGTHERLMDYLAQPQISFHQTVFDREADKDSDLPVIYQVSRQGVVQCFYRVNGTRALVYVLDEQGSLFYQQCDFHDIVSLIKHMQQFLTSVHQRMGFMDIEPDCRKPPGEIEFYHIERGREGEASLEHQNVTRYVWPNSYVSVQVLCDYIEDETVFTIYCQDKEFSSLRYGKNIYVEVAKCILEKRGSDEKYPVYITDMDLSRALLGEEVKTIQTYHYLSYKKIIEEYLSTAMQTLSSQN